MSTVIPVKSDINKYVIKVTWEGITTTNSDGDWIELPHYPEKTIQIDGNFGTGGELTIQGKNVDSYTPFVLSDFRGESLVKLANYGGNISENPLKIRPVLTAGSGSVDLDITIICVQK